MSVSALFIGLEVIAWLTIGLVAWTGVTFWRRPRASFLALGAALVVALIAGPLPGLLGWDTLGGLLFGLLLASICSTVAAWQTMERVSSKW
ncbi:MAG: hypothetical protein ACYDCQ_00060 [Dehalococcoidia bacterium]